MLWGSYSMVAKAVWWGSRWVTTVASHCSVNNSSLLLLSNCYVLTTLLFLAIPSLFPSLFFSNILETYSVLTGYVSRFIIEEIPDKDPHCNGCKLFL